MFGTVDKVQVLMNKYIWVFLLLFDSHDTLYIPVLYNTALF